MTVSARFSIAGLQVALGIAAHVTAAGCLPAPSAVAAVVPALLLALAVPFRALRAVPRSVVLIGGQCLVHAVMSVAAVCGGHEGTALHAPAVAEAPAWLVMAPAHVLALLLSVVAAAHVERAAQTAVHLGAHLLGGLQVAVALLTHASLPVLVLPRVAAQRRPARLRPIAALTPASPRAPPAWAAPTLSFS